MPAALIGKEKETTVYLHGLGKDSFMKCENTNNADIHSKLAEQNVIRVVFKNTDDWDERKSSCVKFHRKVNLFDCVPL